jgi:hypothetical protein
MMTDSGDFSGTLRPHLGKLLGGDVSPAAFWHWFINRWWSAESSVPDEDWALGESIEHLFYIYNDGHYTEEELKREIRATMIEANRHSGPAIAPGWRSTRD